MGLRFRRLLVDARRLDRQEWSDETASGRVAIGCPACGRVQELDAEHTPNRVGIVELRWQCEDESCPWSDWISLDSYAEERAA